MASVKMRSQVLQKIHLFEFVMKNGRKYENQNIEKM